MTFFGTIDLNKMEVLGKRLLVRILTEEKSREGILFPSYGEDEISPRIFGQIEKIGPEVPSSSKLVVGQKVIFSKFERETELMINGEKYIFIPCDGILCIFES